MLPLIMPLGLALLSERLGAQIEVPTVKELLTP
jgi:hypothetical protein